MYPNRPRAICNFTFAGESAALMSKKLSAGANNQGGALLALLLCSPEYVFASEYFNIRLQASAFLAGECGWSGARFWKCLRFCQIARAQAGVYLQLTLVFDFGIASLQCRESKWNWAWLIACGLRSFAFASARRQNSLRRRIRLFSITHLSEQYKSAFIFHADRVKAEVNVFGPTWFSAYGSFSYNRSIYMKEWQFSIHFLYKIIVLENLK